MNTSHTREPITCAHCGHAIRENEPVIADLPGDVPDDLSREAFRHWHLNCQEYNSGASCFQVYASKRTPFAAQTSATCAMCGHAIGQGELVLRETFWVWTMPAHRERDAEAAGRFSGVNQAFKTARGHLSFRDLPFRLKQKFVTSGPGNGSGIRTAAEAEELYRPSVPKSVRSMGTEAVSDHSRGEDASHRVSVANSPGKARHASARKTAMVAFAAGLALGAGTPLLLPLGIGIYGVYTYRRTKNDDLLERNVLYFHASCGEREDNVSCFEAFAAEVSESATDQGEAD